MLWRGDTFLLSIVGIVSCWYRSTLVRMENQVCSGRNFCNASSSMVFTMLSTGRSEMAYS